MATILLLLALLHTAIIIVRGKTFRPRLKPTPGDPSRARLLYGWGWGLIVSFGIPAAVGLLMIRVYPLQSALPAELDIWPADWNGVAAGPLMTGIVLGTLLNAAITHWRIRRGRRAFAIGRFPDIGPQRVSEIAPAVWLSVCAGVCEELFFRLFVPLLIARVFGSAWAAAIAGALLFGAVHRYQGRAGVVATTLLGLGLSVLFAATGLLWTAIALHVVVDLNALIVRPLLSRPRREA